MINFSKNSWHYRFNKWCSGNLFTIDYAVQTNSLCLYFWQTVYNLFATAVVTPVGLWLGLSAFGLLISVPYEEMLKPIFNWFPLILPLLGVVVLSAIGVCLYCYVLGYEKFTSRRKTVGDKEPSVITEWVKAKKEKVCPSIKFED